MPALIGNWFNTGSVRARVARGIVVIVALTVLVGGGVQARINYVQTVSLAKQLQRSEAAAAAQRIEAFLDLAVNPMQRIARMPWGVGDLNEAYRVSEFQRLLKAVPALSEIEWLDKDGRSRVFLSRSRPDRVDLSAWPIDKLAPVRDDMAPSFGVPYREDGLEYQMVIAVRDSRLDGGTTRATINLKFVSDLTEQLRIGKTGMAYVRDGNGNILAHPRLMFVLGHRPDQHASLAPLAGTGESTTGWTESGIAKAGRNIVSSAPVGTTGWHVVVQQAESEVLAPVLEVLVQTALLLLAVLLLALYLGRRISSSIVAPIEVLDQESRRIAAGDFSARASVSGSDEIAKLAHSFNEMAVQLQEYTGQLEQKVAEKTAQLELANRHKSEFLANMSHELRTPLNAIIGFSDVLKAEMFGALNEKQKEYAGDISASGQHLLSLINDILDLSKVEAGRMDLELRSFSLRAALDNAILLVRGQAASAGIQVQASIEEGIDEITGDERKIKQILINLLSNAVKFSHQGGWVRVGVHSGDNGVIVRVADSGPGIAKENQALIFEAFQQLKPESAHKYQGTGLGLTLVKRLVELHGGRVWVESEQGLGATFCFTLPTEPPKGTV